MEERDVLPFPFVVSRGKSPHWPICMASGCPSSEPDAEASLIALRATYKAAEAKLNELRKAGADRTAIAHAADSLRALVPQLHALQVGSKKHRRSNNKNGSGRAAAFRRFLISTFGRAEMASGSGVLDVCGGQGGLAFELLNLHDVPVTVIDPGATNEAAIGGRGRTVRRFERQFEHVRRVQSGSQASQAGGAEELSQGEAASETGQSKQLRYPAHWPVYWRDEVWRPIAAEMRSQSQAAASSSGRDVSAEAGAEDNLGGLTPSGDTLSALTRALDAAAAPGLPPPPALEAWHVLHSCSAVVGMHPDAATESILDFALATNKPFAIVPCCVFATDSPWRLLDGKAVTTTADFIRYLARKDPLRIAVADLPFEGKNVVLYSRPSTRSSGSALMTATQDEDNITGPCNACDDV